MQQSSRVLVIGLDGATWDVLDPWMRDGTLPHLARLRQGGSWGPLRSSVPPITAAAWSTFMTGKRPGKHGVYHFVKLFEDDGGLDDAPDLVSARSIKSPALWDELAHHDRKVVLVNIPLTYPPRPVNGVMVTGLLTPSTARVFTYPPELSAEITDYQIDLERFADKTPHVDAFEADLTAPTLDLVAEFRAMEEKRARLSFQLMASEEWNFFMVVFTGTDRMGHYLWPYHRSPRPDDPHEVRELCSAVRAFYQRIDEIVGELVTQAGADTSVIVMSDHGMGPVETKRLHCNNWLHQRGYLATRQKPGSMSSADAWLRRLGIPRDKLGKLIHRIPGLAQTKVVKQAANSRSVAVDLERSQAYCVPIFYNIMGVRVRAQGAERDQLCQSLMRELQMIVDPETGQPVIDEVRLASDYYAGPHADNIPDIIAIAKPEYGYSYFVSSYSSVVTRRAKTSGPAKHRNEGIFLAYGPGAQQQAAAIPGLYIEDVAPTVLHLLGLPVPSDMDGKVITEALDAARRSNVTVAESSGYWPLGDTVEYSDDTMSAEDEDELRGRLRALGYFE